jgi:branched-subunit amino acid transport protein
MGGNVYIYIAVMSLVSFAVRVLPLTLIRGQIKSPFIRSFLHYVPYVTLAVMTFPAIVEATQVPVAGALALLVGVVLAWRGAGLFPVAVCCCLTVLAAEGILVR